MGRLTRSNTVTELDAPTGSLAQVLSGSQYGFQDPSAVSSDGTHVWVSNWYGNSVTELDASTGALVQVIKGPSTASTNPWRCPRTARTSGWPTTATPAA